MPFKIRVAESAGFCFGVQKALDKLIDIRNQTGSPVRTLGPLIHNEQVLEALQNRAVLELKENESVAGKHVVLRAHGVTPEMRRQLQENNALICDATCPKVAQVQAIVKKFSRKNSPVIIIGDRGHAEVDGLLGYSGDMGIVITGPEEAETLEGGEHVCVVAQTTQDPQIFEKTVEIIKRKYKSCNEFNTICDATFERQAETQTLAGESDVMVVVGGKHSANTQRLAEIAGKNCKTIMIQTVDDLLPEYFSDVHRVGVTAGASTPAWVIRNVVEKIRLMGWEQSGWLLSSSYKMLSWFMLKPISWAIAVGMVHFASIYAVTGFGLWKLAAILSLLFVTWRSWGKRLNPNQDIGVLALMVFVSISSVWYYTQSFAVSALLATYLGTVFLNRLYLFDCLHVQADKISGNLTIPVITREKHKHQIAYLANGVAALSVLILTILEKNPVTPALILAPIGFCIFQHRKLVKPSWCDLSDHLYLDLPLWFTFLLVFALRLILF